MTRSPGMIGPGLSGPVQTSPDMKKPIRLVFLLSTRDTNLNAGALGVHQDKE
jgi:hypothetical protein